MKSAFFIETTRGSLPFSWGMAALSKFCTEHNMGLQDFAKMENSITPTLLISMLWHGFQDGHRKERKPFEVHPDDIADMLDDDAEMLQRCMEIISKSMPGNSDAGNVPTPGKKKKS